MALFSEYWNYLVTLFGSQAWILWVITILTVTAIIDLIQRRVLSVACDLV
jgi:hypothetical protein